MNIKNAYDIIIIGGSYAGLAAAMALGRSMRKVLIIDSGKPCNGPTPHSHNFLTHDGEKPVDIAQNAKNEVVQYDTVQFYEGLAVSGKKTHDGFEVKTKSENTFRAKKLIFATGLKDIMPNIKGFAACWGKTIIHCPYCHGYEYRHKKTGILANGGAAMHYAELISNWTKDLTVFTNGKSTLSEAETEKIKKNGIQIIETKIDFIKHNEGNVQKIILEDGSKVAVDAVYSSPEKQQHCDIPEKMGCQIEESGLIEINNSQETTIEGIYACGDNSGKRILSVAVASGTMTGIHLNHQLIEEEFSN
ncbi:pyridine nucleotide-disulfide oxidoreductase [Aquimarina atlantica]|uniref:Pyridine nucleotide-disulfide oxidoreductase n=1 Tax=Aquimarina atlantica TaxID=1317122 RepID=A0A023BTQ6_9FLAO|nr:NAD(P)/FAD-dependent oxidoreductase [Aquimarina atlantica]EZH73365.1 pyridine nucleotide-disulfide oxidoreductase [Aquimarina atlantica]